GRRTQRSSACWPPCGTHMREACWRSSSPDRKFDALQEPRAVSKLLYSSSADLHRDNHQERNAWLQGDWSGAFHCTAPLRRPSCNQCPHQTEARASPLLHGHVRLGAKTTDESDPAALGRRWKWHRMVTARSLRRRSLRLKLLRLRSRVMAILKRA